MQAELILKFNFEASHSLSGYEAPHPHLWGLEVILSGEPVDGKIVDIVKAREKIEEIIEPLKFKYLNDLSYLDPPAQRAPTCETLSYFFLNKIRPWVEKSLKNENPTVGLVSVGIAIRNMDGEEMGFVRLKHGIIP